MEDMTMDNLPINSDIDYDSSKHIYHPIDHPLTTMSQMQNIDHVPNPKD